MPVARSNAPLVGGSDGFLNRRVVEVSVNVPFAVAFEQVDILG